MNSDEAGEWLPVKAAAIRLGTTEAGIRSRINRRTLRHRKGNDGKVAVFVPNDAASDRPLIEDDAANRLRLERDAALAQAEHWRGQAEAARVEAAIARGERDAGKETIRVLEEQVRWLKQPWWRRWRG